MSGTISHAIGKILCLRTCTVRACTVHILMGAHSSGTHRRVIQPLATVDVVVIVVFVVRICAPYYVRRALGRVCVCVHVHIFVSCARRSESVISRVPLPVLFGTEMRTDNVCVYICAPQTNTRTHTLIARCDLCAIHTHTHNKPETT